MKKVILSLLVGAFVLTSCEKKQAVESEEQIMIVDNDEDVLLENDTVETDSVATDDTMINDSDVISINKYEGDGKEVTATYMGTEAGEMSIKIEVDGETYTLPQKEAWAKGAVYSEGNIEFTNKGQINEAELKINDQTYNLKFVQEIKD